ncbi:M56 family metallopeptidase [Dactylosporangium aurantiacum]|uniref:M56 family metallopeptidase n=1 Tax=Dactylosporangium aurantiacum TaxID=35754 RepID=A0A9Q9ME82_9ACTN|nr:M56 family metallopeptidase [Dactylosporangium aurantiacum]MDG6108756.1 M56 family metallopeptidase [Dactylosporangium aurantiacum]UWZ51115.1 M56 family metallopeptidase [Dactylosporangium aurantiacum]
MSAVLLGAFTAALALVAAPRLARARWVLRSPAVAIFAWQMTCAAALVSVGLIGVTTTTHWDSAQSLMCRAWQLCLDAVQGAHGRRTQAAAVLGASLIAGVAIRLTIGACRLAVAERRRRRSVLAMLRLAGSRVPALDATVVPAEHPAAFLVPGGRTDVVVTSAAVRRLTPDELRAVMAHERAHATGRHYWLLRTVRLLHIAFPWIPMFSTALHQVHRLVELRADEIAVRSSGPLALARALVTMAEAGARPAGTDPGLLAMDGGDTAERLERLLQPPAPLSRAGVRLATVAAALLPLTPVAMTVASRYAGIS